MNNSRVRIIFLTLFSLSMILPVSAEDSSTKIDQYMSRLSGFGFSGALLVAQNGKVIIDKGYGLADRQKSLPITKDTAFDIGSNTKDFTKLAILQLAESKRLSLDEKITRFFENLPADKTGITVAQLMDHTAGFGMYAGRDDEKLTKEEFLRRVLTSPLGSEPGMKENYSNPGYGLLAAIIEKASGQSFEQYLDQHIYKPAGMNSTGYLIPAWHDGQIAHSYNNGHDRGSTFDVAHLQDGISWSLRGAGGTLSTLGDMYKFHQALEGEKLLSKEYKSKLFDMQSPITLVGGNGIHYFVYLRDPANQLVILIASTDAGLRAIEIDQNILSLTKGKDVALPPATTALDRASLNKLAGSYKLANGASISVAVKDDHLFVGGINQEGFDLLAGPRRGRPEQIEKMNAQVKAMLEASAKGDHSLTHKAFGAAMPLEEFKPRQEALWKRRREQFGEFKGVTILGTVPGQPDFVTTARIDFERGIDYSQFLWGGGALRGILPSAPPPGRHFYAQSPAKFVSFRARNNEAISISFKPKEGSQEFSLVVENVDQPPVSANVETKSIPDTPAGRVAAAYLKAFNSGEEKSMLDFFNNNLAKASLAGRPIEDRLKIFHRMRDDLGNLQVDSIVESSEKTLTMTMQSAKGPSVEFRFEMDAEEPGKLKSLGVDLR
jgi:CubicO group peptidase (beta-lactamase class C family)